MALLGSSFTEFGPTTLESHAGISFDDADATFNVYSSSLKFEDSDQHTYLDEHRFCGLHPLGRKGFTLQAFGHLGAERYELDNGEDIWSAGAPNKDDLITFEAWQNTLGKAAEDLPHEWIDPITLGVMRNPCRAADGFVYERASIREWMQRQRVPTSPLTGAVLATRTLRPETTMQQRIRAELSRRGAKSF